MPDPKQTFNDELNQALTVKQVLDKMAGGEELDDQLILDSIEGESDLIELLEQFDRDILDMDATQRGLASVIKDLTDRKSRIKRGMEAKRNLILAAMLKLDLPRLPIATGTYTVRKTARKPIVTDETELPSIYFVTPEPPPPAVDMKALTAALQDREKEIERRRALLKGAEMLELPDEIPGATLDNGGVSISCRRK